MLKGGGSQDWLPHGWTTPCLNLNYRLLKWSWPSGSRAAALWTTERHRPTRDPDLLAYGNNEVERLIAIFRDVCSDPFEDDGPSFDIQAIKGDRVREEADYEGIRISFVAHLGNIRIPIQIDIGFGDVVRVPSRNGCCGETRSHDQARNGKQPNERLSRYPHLARPL